LFERPASHFAAEFMGVTNLLPGEVAGSDRFLLKGGDTILVPVAGRAGPHAFAIRPERLEIDGEASAANTLSAEVEIATYRGLVIDYRVKTPSGLCLTARRPSPAAGGPAPLPVGRPVRVSFAPEAGTHVPKSPRARTFQTCPFSSQGRPPCPTSTTSSSSSMASSFPTSTAPCSRTCARAA
ncbi:MAG: hypothetical protein B7X76_07855, partial [Azorhizobium sp. 39-67-5]